MKKKKNRAVRFWAFKIFFITLALTAGISVVTEMLMDNMSVSAAAFIIVAIMLVGVAFDIIGIAFATCDPTPFVSMASRKVKKAKHALSLLRNADIVSNICGDVVGDICGIVSGAAGAAVAIKLAMRTSGTPEFVWTIVVSSVIAAFTVSCKAAGKSIAIRNNKQIVNFVSYLTIFFARDGK